MHSLTAFTVLLLAKDVFGRALQAPTPVITPAPDVVALIAEKRQGPDAVSLAQVLLTAIPESLRKIAATNVPAVSSILWEEFLDDKKPWWFLELPEDIQSYLVEQFGPPTAIPNPTPPAWSSAEITYPSAPVETTGGAESSVPSWETQISQSGSLKPSSPTASYDTTGSSGSTGSSVSQTTFKSSTLPTSSSTIPPAPLEEEEENHSGLTKRQKVGVGVGVPLAIFAVAGLAFGCCLLRRRRRNKSVNGSVPPSSPGFIPRFAFQEKSYENLVQQDMLYHSSDSSGQDLRNMAWDDDVIEHTDNQQQTGTSNQKPVMAPALFHTHSSNRARGKRTSYQSLHSVPEVSEADEAESPVLGRHFPPRPSPVPEDPMQPSSPKTPTSPRNIIPPPMAAAVPQIKRKPVPSSPTSSTRNSTADLASQNLLRQTMPDAFIMNNNNNNHPTSRFGNHTSITSGGPPFTSTSTEVSPIEERRASNPFSNNYAYVEDHGPEYYTDPYIDFDNGLYGGNTNLSRNPNSSTGSSGSRSGGKKASSRTEWPLRNTGKGQQRRNRSPMWDRVYES